MNYGVKIFCIPFVTLREIIQNLLISHGLTRQFLSIKLGSSVIHPSQQITSGNNRDPQHPVWHRLSAERIETSQTNAGKQADAAQ